MTKILVEDATGLIKHQGRDYAFDVDRVVVFDPVTEVVDFYFGDLNVNTASSYEIDNVIADFMGNKYLYQDGQVVNNPDWENPE